MNTIVKILACMSVVSMFLIALLNTDRFLENPMPVIVPVILGILFLFIVIRNWKSYQL
ncbi:MAG TPA: hypothetical protein VK982_15410 [Bacteroidales bacterium]|nr:hypothetical protein [Bacteroidales bacterium]